MTTNADIIIIGGGVIGCSTAFHLAALGAKNVILLEKEAVSSGGTGRSCAIIRTHYSISSNLIHAVESLRVFADFDNIVGGECGWRRTGYLIVGPESHRQPMQAVFALQNEHGIDTATLTPAEANDIHPLLQFEDAGVIGYDSMAGYADPYLTTTAYARRARDLGVSIRTDEEVQQIFVEGSGYRLETSAGGFRAGQVLIAAGPWTGQLASTLGASLPYEISRHKVITLKIEQDYDLSWPIVKDLTTPDKIYFRPEVGGVVLVGTGDHGEPIERPEMGFGNSVERSHIDRIAPLVANRMPSFSDARYVAGWTGPYDITPDWNPILDELPESPGAFVAVGFSGHGFKLAPTLGEGLARRILDLPSRISIEPYGLSRFALGQALSGAYGIGSIS